jgi:hypothetical protein
MMKNLETADEAVKLILSVAITVLYFMRLITGPFATALVILAIIILGIFLVKMVYTVTVRD